MLSDLIEQLHEAARAEAEVDDTEAPEDRAFAHRAWQREIDRLAGLIAGIVGEPPKRGKRSPYRQRTVGE